MMTKDTFLRVASHLPEALSAADTTRIRLPTTPISRIVAGLKALERERRRPHLIVTWETG